MICKIQVVTIGEDGHQETREIACLQRTDLKPEISSFLLPKRPCPECGQLRCIKGHHTLSIRTVFGLLTMRSPRLHHCTCGPHETKTFSPLAELLPNRTPPELLFLETKWALLMSYGMTSDLLQEVLAIDEPVSPFTIRQHVADVAERLERELGDKQFCFIEGCRNIWDQLPAPDGSADGQH